MPTHRIVYAGTPDFAVPALRVLCDHPDIEVVAVYTQPDRPAGRGRRMRPSPVKAFARERGLTVHQPERLSSAAEQATLAELEPDLMVVAAYGLLLPKAVLETPRLGCVNLHASLLPRWRGAAPIQRAIEAGDEETGVTLMQMAEGLDTGDMLAKVTTPIEPRTTGGELHDRLAELAAQLLNQHLEALLAGQLSAEPQCDADSCYARKLDKTEAEIDWRQSAAQLARRILAFNPWPVAFTHHRGQRLRLWRAEPAESAGPTEPGTVGRCDREGLLVACGKDGQERLRITELQRTGGRAMAAADFANAHDLGGERLGS
ncbi:MAG: methionyl-tRNA formyltransferase [Pseudomonadota bacterium]